MLLEMTSYQRLKAANAKLKEDIRKLVMEPESEEGLITKMEYQIEYEFEKVIWHGSTSTPTSFNGIIQ
jgi:hypothetical protein